MFQALMGLMAVKMGFMAVKTVLMTGRRNGFLARLGSIGPVVGGLLGAFGSGLVLIFGVFCHDVPPF